MNYIGELVKHAVVVTPGILVAAAAAASVAALATSSHFLKVKIAQLLHE